MDISYKVTSTALHGLWLLKKAEAIIVSKLNFRRSLRTTSYAKAQLQSMASALRSLTSLRKVSSCGLSRTQNATLISIALRPAIY